MSNKRKSLDCRKVPSEMNCSLKISGSEEEIMPVAIFHLIDAHQHQDSPEFREELRKALADDED
jgi:predicted small metal-binding protein